MTEILAPDGIIIRPIAGAESGLVSLVVGVISPRDADYAVHRHVALEQVTYVLRGSVTAISRRPGESAATEVVLGPGEAITTPPTATLSFRNRGREAAEVLFICAPPYPTTDADTELVEAGHVPLTPRQLELAIERHRVAQEYALAVIGARLHRLRWEAAR